MIRGYSISEEDIDRVMPFVRGVIHELEVGNATNIELSLLNLGPCQFMDVFDKLGYDRDDDWDTNGWEQDTWYYFSKKGSKKLSMYYCGYTGEISLCICEEEH